MQVTQAVRAGRGSRAGYRLLQSTSLAALALTMNATPAQAQLAALRASLGVAPVVVTPVNAVPMRPVGMREVLARSVEHQLLANNMRGAILEAQKAAIAAIRNPALAAVRDGLKGADGSNADAGLDPVRSGTLAALDTTGVNTWQGATLPTQVDKDGKPLVTIIQTDSRAILSWNRFDVGANTTLNFEQKLNGVAQPGWVALNRVANSVAPSRILGSIKADGTVAVINSRGVVFEKGSQVNLHSLLVSSLDIGDFTTRKLIDPSDVNSNLKDAVATIADRNLTFLASGLQSSVAVDGKPIYLVSSVLDTVNDFTSIPSEGGITIDRGATVNAVGGGFIIATAPSVTNAGILSVPEGQVSLQAGRAVSYAISTGAATATDIVTGISPDVRGLVLRSWFGLDGAVSNSGLIDVPRGYISLGTGESGTVTNLGLLASTTSVARNAKISLTGGTILLGSETIASGIVVTPDANGETVPIGTVAAPPAFKSTKIEIGNIYLSRGRFDEVNSSQLAASFFGPAAVRFDAKSLLLAPNADVVVGGKGFIEPNLTQPIYQPLSLGSIDVLAGAIIDVSGVKDLLIDPSRNSLMIDPLKRNELRDTPTYRELTTNGDFTLNGATIYLDPRLSGVRNDGVAWVGSPLIEAGSAASQIPVTAAELMTPGGTVSMAVATATTQLASAALGNITPLQAPTINIAKGSVIDFSGGWVRFGDGFVRSSKLLTSDGRIVEIGKADPNDDYIAVGDGFTEIQAKFGVSRTFANSLLQGGRLEVGYDEGRDAGALSLTATTMTIEGLLDGRAFAGVRQSAGGIRGTRASNISGDLRKLQSTASQLASSGALIVSAGRRDATASDASYGADILIYNGNGSAVARPFSEILLSDTAILDSGLSSLSLYSSGRVSFAADTDVRLANGGALSVIAGRTITLDGKITVPSGTIAATIVGRNNGTGSAFQVEPVPSLTNPPRLADIVVVGALSAAGLWVNDFGKFAGETTGAGYADGGSISFTTLGAVASNSSLVVADEAMLDVSSGGYVNSTGRLQLTAKGGNISLINRTSYATPVGRSLTSGSATVYPVAVSPYVVGGELFPTLVLPDDPTSEVRFSARSLTGFGFAGGGTFTLVAPKISMGSDVTPGGAGVGLDFLQKTGFATLDLSVNDSKVVKNLFSGTTGSSYFAQTSLYRVAANDTLDLTQWVRSPLVDTATSARLIALQTGGDLSFITPVKPTDAFDQRAANLRLGGLTELDVEAGGTIVGAAGATINVSKLLNAGTIRIAGGSIIQRFSPEQAARATRFGFGIRDSAFGGNGLSEIFGGATGDGPYSESALTSAILFSDVARATRLTNKDVFASQFFNKNLYLLGRLDADEGIRFAAGSITDLSGTAVLNPRPPLLPTGQLQLTGRVIAGGTIATGPVILTREPSGSPLSADTLFAQKLNALPGSTIDLRGASASFDVPDGPSTYAKSLQWSNGGRLSLLGGGTLGGSAITAQGGAPLAEGGTLEWLDPVMRQTDTGVRADNVLFSSQIGASGAGFDTLVAYNGFTVDGVGGSVDLTLGKSFELQTSGPAVIAAAGASFTVNAPFVRLARTNEVLNSIVRPMPVGTGVGTLEFNASRNLDLVGNVSFSSTVADAPRTSVTFRSKGDIRLIGKQSEFNGITAPGLIGGVASNGDMTFSAGQIYATTGTGNAQIDYELPVLVTDAGNTRRTNLSTPFAITSSAADGLITFLAEPGAIASDAYSAGSAVTVRAAKIVQGGTLRAPLGKLTLGSNFSDAAAPATQSLDFVPGSVTSVSGAGKTVPYGVTTDLTSYLFSPNGTADLTAPPVGQLDLSGGTINVSAGATIDGRGGGEIFAYEFVSGTGGSRDVLDRFNPDSFSGNAGFQYADKRQVYAILPKDQADKIAKFDPVYAADYQGADGRNIYGGSAGRAITIDASPGLAAGEYILLPAHYALIPELGALRVVENVGALPPIPGTATTLRDGSVIVGGTYSTAGLNLAESQRRSFTLQSNETFRRSSRIETTLGTAQFVALAAKQNRAVPRLPIDAARTILSPLTELKVAGLFQTGAAAGGRGAQIDIGGKNISLTGAATPVVAAPGVLTLTTETLAKLNASSLLIGGQRTDNADGTTTLGVLADTIDIDSQVNLVAPELIFAVAGQGSRLTMRDGAVLTATGITGDARTGDYIVGSNATPLPSDLFDFSGIGAVLRVAGGTERLVQRQGDFALRNTLRPSELTIGVATINGSALTIDSSRTFKIDENAVLNAAKITVSSDALQFGKNFIEAGVEATLAKAASLTLKSPDVVRFSAATPHVFNDLRLDTPGLSLTALTGAAATTPSTLSITAKNLTLTNSSKALADCTAGGVLACGRAGNSLIIDANSIAFGSGTFGTYGFDKSVTLNASNGMFVEGAGIFEVTAPAASLTLKTPFLIDRTASDLRNGYVRPDFQILTDAAFTMTALAQSVVLPVGQEAPGARIAIGSKDAPVKSASIDGAYLRATSGLIDIRSTGSIVLAGATTLATPGYAKSFGDAGDPVLISANAGNINLISTTGGIDAAATTRLIVDNGTGEAGALNLIATRGTVNLAATLNPGMAAGTARTSSLTVDAARIANGSTLFDFAAFVAENGSAFGGDLAIRTGTGNLTLNAAQKLSARSVLLTADDAAIGQGLITIAGTIDTSGDDVTALRPSDPRYNAARVDGGNIALYGNGGVTLAATGKLVATTSGYSALDSRVATAGNVTLGSGRVSTVADPVSIRLESTLASSAEINVSALRPGYRLVSQFAKDPVTGGEITTYRYAEADKGGAVTFRAQIGAGNTVDVQNSALISGARSLEIEAFKRFDLQAIGSSNAFSGISADGVRLNAAATGKPNFLADLAPGTLPDFVRNFSITAANGQSFGAFSTRPGIELVSNDDIILDSILNLGAGTITNYAGAVAAGLLERSPLGPDASGNPRYQVVPNAPGKAFENETQLFNRFVDMTYRVGGSVAGAAPVLTIRAADDVDVANSVTDGFFAFHDRSNEDYISYQLGGGDRSYNPALTLNCGAADNCANAAPYIVGSKPVGSDINRISIGRAVQGDDVAPFINSPYHDSVNSVAASGTGDPLGVAELFPLVNGSAAKSSGIRLVGGSGTISVNPLHTDAAMPGSVFVSGERSYQVERSVTGTTLSLAGGLQLRQPVAGDPTGVFDVDRYFAEKYQNEEERDRAKNSYTILTWGGGSTADANDARAAARGFFTGGQEFTVFGRVQTGVIARLEDVVTFLARPIFAGNNTYAENVVAGTPGYDAAPLTRIAAKDANGTSVYPSLTSSNIFTSTTVRTGNGNIAIAASADVDTLRAQNIRYRNRGGGTSTINFASEDAQSGNALIGSNAIYTAGTRADGLLPSGLMMPLEQQERLDDRLERETVGPISFAGIASGVKPISPVFANNGGSISIAAGGDIVGRRDVWSNRFGPDYRIGQVGLSTQAASAPEYFSSGIGTLAGGNVSIRSGGVVRDLTVALATNVFTTDFNGAGTLVSLGAGNLDINVGTDLIGGRLNVASGAAAVKVDGSVIAAGVVGSATSAVANQITINDDRRNLLNIRLSDATFKIAAAGTIDIGGISAFGTRYDLSKNDFGFYTPVSSLSVISNEKITYAPNEISQRYAINFSKNAIGVGGNPAILPGSLQLGSLNGDLELGTTVVSKTGAFQATEQKFLYPSIYGQLGLYAGGEIADLKLTMLDANPADLPGPFSVFRTSPSTGSILAGVDFQLLQDGASDATARLDHNRRITHLGNATPARIFADGSIRNAYIVLPKQARIGAGIDIVDLIYRGQNLTTRDVTRITAGNDITATRATAIFVNPTLTLPFNAGNDIAVGGPGALFVEAGRNLGPFIVSGNGLSGGIRTVGNDANPWLSDTGAKLYAMFGLKAPMSDASSGANYDALIQSYLNPVNFSNVDGDLFEQNVDSDGNAAPDRSRYVYAPILAQWLYDNEPGLFDRVFANPALRDAAAAADGATLAEAKRLAADSSLSASEKAAAVRKLTAAQTLAAAAYPKMGDLYAEFASLSTGTASDPSLGVLRQRQFLLDKLYFGELQAPADPAGNSYLQYVRAYRAVDTLFPALVGYTDNLSTYTRDPATISATNPFGILVKKLDASGQPLVATKVKTGDADLRLSAFQTTRGGDITLIGPGGDIIAGSVVRLEAQLARTAQGVVPPEFASEGARKITSFPIGNEGVLTLRTGGIRSFTDGDFRLNQSRLFAVRGGDLVLFSANGDLNAGQGPKTSSSFPPITLRFDPNGLAEIDSAGSVAGAGIATFRPSPEIAASSVTLVAPVGTVDAGDAGVRASGDVFVAAARVANADNFKVGGAAFGVPAIGTTTAALPAGTSNVIDTNTFRPKTLGEQINDRLSQILVNVLGYVGGSNPCPEGQLQNAAGECQPN